MICEICEICKKFKSDNLQSFINHLRLHKIHPKNYYDLYLKKTKCIHCNNETSFINVFAGYKKFCSSSCVSKYKKKINDNDINCLNKRIGKIYNKPTPITTIKIQCPICKKQFKNSAAIGVHFVWRHKEFQKDNESIVKTIYDKFIKKQNEGKCINCNNETVFKSYTKGYIYNYCSISCAREYEIQNNLGKNKKSTWKYKKYKLPSGKIVTVQGYEPSCLDYLFNHSINENDLILSGIDRPIIYYKYNGKLHKYFPDIFIKNINLLIEVKSKYLYDLYKDVNNIKKREAIKQGYNFIFVIDNNFKKLGDILINDYKK